MDEEVLIDYEDELEVTAPAANAPRAPTTSDDKDKKGYAGIHATGFRLVFLPSLCRHGF